MAGGWRTNRCSGSDRCQLAERPNRAGNSSLAQSPGVPRLRPAPPYWEPRSPAEAVSETRGWSQAGLATRLGVSGSVLWRWESGQRQPKGGYLATVYALLGDDPRPAPVLIGERLKRHREQLGLTLSAMAARLHVAQSTLCRWEAGDREPEGPYLWRVQQELRADCRPMCRPTN